MLLENRAVKAALESARASETETIADQIRFCEVPAPPFKEAARAEVLERVFKQSGLRNVRIDGAGNVLGDRPGAALRPRLVIAAHLDTVFPEETNVKVSREGRTTRAGNRRQLPRPGRARRDCAGAGAGPGADAGDDHLRRQRW